MKTAFCIFRGFNSYITFKNILNQNKGKAHQFYRFYLPVAHLKLCDGLTMTFFGEYMQIWLFYAVLKLSNATYFSLLLAVRLNCL